MKILFVYPDLGTHQFAHISHGLASIAAVVAAGGHAHDLLWVREEMDDDDFVSRVRDRSPDLVGFSSTTLQWPYTLRYARALKRARPEFPLIIGGLHATLDSERVWAHGVFDFLCVGEGERPTLELADALEGGADFRRIANLWVRDGGAVIKNPLRDWISPLDALPFPDRTRWDNELVLSENGREAALMASRGCPYSCTYCSNSALRRLPAGGRHVRLKSPEYVIAEIADLVSRYEVRSLFFEDEVFTLRRPWVDRFCELYQARFRLPFTVYVRQELVDRRMLETLHDAGCAEIKLGVETGNEDLRLSVLGRRTKNDKIIEFFRTAHEVGLKTWIFNMVGIPGETLESIEETIALNRTVMSDHVQVTMFYPFPGTRLYELCRERGYLADADSTSLFAEDSVLSLPTISRAELREAFLRFRRIGLEIMAEQGGAGYFDLCARLGAARVKTASPEYVQLMPVRIGGDERMSVLAHPPAEITWRVAVRPGSALRFGIGFSPTVWDRPGGGAAFTVTARAGRWRGKTIFEKLIDPKNRNEDRKWHDFEVSLEAFADKTIDLTLVTSTPPGQNQYCVAAWGKPYLAEK